MKRQVLPIRWAKRTDTALCFLTYGGEKRLQRTKEVYEREQSADESNLIFSSPYAPFFLHLGPVHTSFHLLLPTALQHGLQLAVPALVRY